MRGVEQGGFPATNLREIIFLLAWTAISVYLLAHFRLRIEVMGIVILPLVVVLMLATLLIPQAAPGVDAAAGRLPDGVEKAIRIIHIIPAVLGVSAQPGGGRWRPAVLAAVALAAVLILGGLLGGFGRGDLGFGGPNAPWGGMMGPGMMSGPMMGGWGGASPSGSPVAGDSVGMKSSAFSPPNLLVRAGTTVTWTNDDALPHTVTATDGAWSSGDLQPGGTFRRTFADPGAYPYLCLYHPLMVGTVTVER